MRLGEYLLESGRFVGPEPWSSLADNDLVMHEWAPEVLYALVYGAGGWTALAYLQALGVVAVLIALYACARRFSPPLMASVVTIAGWFGTSGSLALRPQTVSFALFAITVTAWLLTVEDGRPRWWLIPMAWAWACAHGMWFLGVGIGALVVIGTMLDRAHRGRTQLKLVAIPLASTSLCVRIG